MPLFIVTYIPITCCWYFPTSESSALFHKCKCKKPLQKSSNVVEKLTPDKFCAKSNIYSFQNKYVISAVLFPYGHDLCPRF